MVTLVNLVILAVSMYILLTLFLLFQHELTMKLYPVRFQAVDNGKSKLIKSKQSTEANKSSQNKSATYLSNLKFNHATTGSEMDIDGKDNSLYMSENKGSLICNGSKINSEVIYWKSVSGDNIFESPITPHHGEHHSKYITFEYDAGGWNNVRMGMECLLVVAHATGRTLVIPPQQHLYLLGLNHQDAGDKTPHDEMGFEDFFDLELLGSHQGLHIMSMVDFLSKEALTGQLRSKFPPKNSSEAWGPALWHYLKQVADVNPSWRGRYIAFPAHPDDFEHPVNLHSSSVPSLLTSNNSTDQNQQPVVSVSTLQRMKAFGGDRSAVYYDKSLQQAKHIHFPAEPEYRLLQHHYAFAFFADPSMQSFYRRFVRDYMRYKDPIQCAGHTLLEAVRQEALAVSPQHNGQFYALHIRRGDFQFKEVKISAEEIVNNLKFPNGTSIIPSGAMVYISTDDPDGACKGCMVQRKWCNTYESPKPVGCPEDTSWKAFIKAGWKIRFLRDFLRRGYLSTVNPNTHGMIESIVCSRAAVFAGTYFSTFTGYIHRLRGYHGLGENTYYHSKQYVMYPQMKKSIGHGFSREWRAGWTDDGGDLI